MNLIVDIGNTLIKLFLFENQSLGKKEVYEVLDIRKLKNFVNPEKIKQVLISNVGDHTLDDCIEELYASKLIFLHKDLKFNFNNLYETPNTLGVDRIALTSAAIHSYPNKNCLVIDIGSCITYDYVDANRNYYGGAISPGARLRFSAMHQLTANLPLLKVNKNKSEPLGKTTEKSMQSGVLNGITYEIEGFIKHFHEKNKNLTVILTGGGAELFVDKIKFPIFADINFLAKGLNYILENNI